MSWPSGGFETGRVALHGLWLHLRACRSLKPTGTSPSRHTIIRATTGLQAEAKRKQRTMSAQRGKPEEGVLVLKRCASRAAAARIANTAELALDPFDPSGRCVFASPHGEAVPSVAAPPAHAHRRNDFDRV
jgi:hypothetical protein